MKLEGSRVVQIRDIAKRYYDAEEKSAERDHAWRVWRTMMDNFDPSQLVALCDDWLRKPPKRRK